MRISRALGLLLALLATAGASRAQAPALVELDAPAFETPLAPPSAHAHPSGAVPFLVLRHPLGGTAPREPLGPVRVVGMGALGSIVSLLGIVSGVLVSLPLVVASRGGCIDCSGDEVPVPAVILAGAGSVVGTAVFVTAGAELGAEIRPGGLWETTVELTRCRAFVPALVGALVGVAAGAAIGATLVPLSTAERPYWIFGYAAGQAVVSAVTVRLWLGPGGP